MRRPSRFAAVVLFLLSLSALPLAQSTTSPRPDGEPPWYLPTKDGCKLFVREFGRGSEVIVVLHGGFGAEHSYLLDAFDHIGKPYRLVFYDQRGSLRSPCPDDRITVGNHVDDLERLRSELKVPKIILVGHSMGTYLAMAYLAQYPEHVKRVVLLGAVSPKRATTSEELVRQKESDDGAQQFLKRPEISAQLHEEGLDRPKEQLSAKDQTAAWRVRFAGANMYNVNRWRQIEGGGAFYNEKAGTAASKSIPTTYNFLPALGSWHGAVSVILGDHDFVDFGGAMWQHWTSLLPNARLSLIPKAGHNAWLDNPVTFRRELVKALAREN